MLGLAITKWTRELRFYLMSVDNKPLVSVDMHDRILVSRIFEEVGQLQQNSCYDGTAFAREKLDAN